MRYSLSELFKKSRELANNIPAYLSILRIMSAGNQALFVISLLANILLSQFPAVLAYTSKIIIDSLVSGSSRAHSFGSLQGPIFLGCVYLALLLAQHFSQAVLLYINENLTERFSKNIHLEIIKAGIRLEGLYYFENAEFHNRRAILENEALYIPMNFLRFVTDICSICVTMLGMVVLLLGLHPFIPLLIILSGIPDVLTQKKAHRLIYEGIKETAHEERLKDYYRSVLLNEEYAKEVRIYNLKNHFIEKYKEAMSHILQIVLPIRKRQVRSSALSRILVSVGTILPYLWTVGKAVRGEISAGQLVMFMTAIVVIQQQLSRVAQTLAGHQDVNYLMRELASWIQMKPDMVTIARKDQRARKHRLPPQVRIDNLWFKYPGSESFILKGLDLEMPRGKSLAIVGRNGGGKTTLVKLLCRLYDPQQGAIYYDDVDIRDIKIEDLRNSTGIIFQDFMRYHLTVKDNIMLEELAGQSVEKMVSEAATTAGAAEFIVQLPQGYETLLGKQFAGGVELSGGQWQKLALARAFFRDAGMLILDEPTASLDIATESRIYAHFKAMTEGKTALLISHRLSTVRIADLIAVVDDGKVVELGDHESLMCLGRIYSEMFMMQAERYRLKDELSTYHVDVQ
jgi:ATP-binding cassette, subfamily B, bacterial